MYHAVVPTEGKAGRQIEAAGNRNKNAHTLPKHGTGTTREQHLLRANTGISPDGKQGFKTDSSRWLRNVDTSDGIAVAKRRWEIEKQLNPDKKDFFIPIIFDKPIGKGYLKNTNKLIETNRAVFRFDENGNLITSYPKIRD